MDRNQGEIMDYLVQLTRKELSEQQAGAIPVLMLIFWTYFLLPIAFKVDVPGVFSVMFALSLIGGAYLGEWLDGLNEGYSTRWSINLILLGLALGIFNVIVFVRKYW